jgi:glucokinase
VRRTFTIGVDLGGTTVKTGVVDNKGKILDQISADSKASKGPPAVIRQILFTIEDLFGRHKQAECRGIGIGAPGVVSIEDEMVKHPPNFAGWADVPLAKHIRKVYPLPVFVENDANVAALAESRFGAGADYKDFLFVIWGSGVGGGIIIDRKLFRGPQGGAGEIGHTSIDYNGPPCNCGRRGCIEAYVGQRYLSARTKAILDAEPAGTPRSKILEFAEGNPGGIDPYVISKAAEAGDQTAREILENAGTLLGYGLASVLNVLDLRVVVVGGGISAAPHYVYEAITTSIRDRVLKPYKSGIRVVRAALGNNAGIIGAASLVM